MFSARRSKYILQLEGGFMARLEEGRKCSQVAHIVNADCKLTSPAQSQFRIEDQLYLCSDIGAASCREHWKSPVLELHVAA